MIDKQPIQRVIERRTRRDVDIRKVWISVLSGDQRAQVSADGGQTWGWHRVTSAECAQERDK